MMFETRDDCAGNAAAHALCALEAGEAAAYRRHLQTCAVCSEEVAALRRVIDALAMAAPQRRVPDRLRRSVLAAATAGPPGVRARRGRTSR